MKNIRKRITVLGITFGLLLLGSSNSILAEEAVEELSLVLSEDNNDCFEYEPEELELETVDLDEEVLLSDEDEGYIIEEDEQSNVNETSIVDGELLFYASDESDEIEVDIQADSTAIVDSRTEDNITWTLYDDGKLIITGSGIITSYGWNYYKSIVKNVCISEGISGIGESVFSEYNIETVDFPSTLVSIGRSAFSNCKYLISVSFPEQLELINDYSFMGCDSLKEIDIPNSVTYVGSWAFRDCSSLEKITLGNGYKYMLPGTFCCNDNLKTIVWGNGLTNIGNYAFMECPSLEEVDIPDGVTVVEYEAFWDCQNLRRVSIPDSVIEMEDGNYSSYPDNAGPFWGCYSLDTIYVSDTVLNRIDIDNAFISTPWLLNYRGTISGAGGDCLFSLNKNGELIISGNGEYVYNPGKDYRDLSWQIKTIIIGEGVTAIHNSNSFLDCINLNKIINNSNTTVMLPDFPDSSWCDIDDNTEPIAIMTRGTAIRVNQRLPKHYLISFDGNGATSGGMEDVICIADTSISLPHNSFSKTGYVFAGWNIIRNSEVYETDYESSSFFYSYNDALECDTLTFRIVWVKAQEVTIHFYSYDGFGNMPDINVYEGEAVVLPENKFIAPDDKEFASWIIDSESYNPYDIINVYRSIWVYPSWKLKSKEVNASETNTGAQSKSNTTVQREAKISEKITISKKPTNKKPSATRNKITVKWSHFKHTTKKTKKIWKGIKKVQVQCAKDKAFKNVVKTVSVNKSKTKATIKGLKKKSTYYVRVRYFDGKGYSKWSSVKKIKTKK